MSPLNHLKDPIKDYAKDIKLNLTAVLRQDPQSGLNNSQIMGIALSSAYASKNETIVQNISLLAKEYVSDDEVNAAKAAASIMGMNNIYYRFIHLVSDKDYQTLPAGLRMNVIGNPGIKKVDFELYCLAVSAFNGCGMCIDAHVHEAEKNYISKTGVQHCIKIAAVVSAVDQALFIN